MGRQTIWAYLSKVCVGNTVFNRLHVSGDGLRLRVLCINGFKMICCQCEQICSSVNVNVLLTSLAGEMGRKKVESSDESVNLMEVNKSKIKNRSYKVCLRLWLMSECEDEWMKWVKDEFGTYMKAGARGWKVNDSWAGSVCKLQNTCTHTHKTHTFRLAG